VGKEIQKDTFVRGAVFGLLALSLPERSHIQVQATEPSTAIRLPLSDLLQLTARHPDFQLANRALHKPSVVGIVHHSEATRPFTSRLVRRLRELEDTPCIAGDDERWKPDRDAPFRLLDADQREVRQEILAAGDS
jgi:CRP-like cAMP-binding protein